MPTPRSGESKSDYISRCIPVLKDEGKKQEQAVAICYSMWEKKNEDIMKRIDRFLSEEDGGGEVGAGSTTVGNIAKNYSKGNVDVVGGKCPDGYKYDSKTKTCVPVVKETSVVGGSYIDGTTVNVIGSGQTRVWGNYNQDIEVLHTKQTGLVTRFNKLLGIYTVDEPVQEKSYVSGSGGKGMTPMPCRSEVVKKRTKMCIGEQYVKENE